MEASSWIKEQVIKKNSIEQTLGAGQLNIEGLSELI